METWLFSGELLAIFGPFSGHGWANFQVQSLSLCLPDFLNIFSRPMFGHVWPFLEHFVIKFRHFWTKLDVRSGRLGCGDDRADNDQADNDLGLTCPTAQSAALTGWSVWKGNRQFEYVGLRPRGPRSGVDRGEIGENIVISCGFLVVFGPFSGHGWANSQAQSLSLYLPDFLNIFSRPTVGHVWSFLDHFVIKVRHFWTKINNSPSTSKPPG